MDISESDWEWIGAGVTMLVIACLVIWAIETLQDWWNNPKH